MKFSVHSVPQMTVLECFERKKGSLKSLSGIYQNHKKTVLHNYKYDRRLLFIKKIGALFSFLPPAIAPRACSIIFTAVYICDPVLTFNVCLFMCMRDRVTDINATYLKGPPTISCTAGLSRTSVLREFRLKYSIVHRPTMKTTGSLNFFTASHIMSPMEENVSNKSNID